MTKPGDAEARPQPSVLVVDDEPASLDAFRRAFRQVLAMKLCRGPHEALEALGAGSFDVVLADHAMPDMTGVELLQAVRERAPEVGRVLVTGYPDVPEVREAARTGLCATVLVKPWKREDIVRWAQHFQKVRSMRRALSSLRETLTDDPEPKT